MKRYICVATTGESVGGECGRGKIGKQSRIKDRRVVRLRTFRRILLARGGRGGEDGFVVISVCIMSRTVLLRGKIPRETMQDTRANMGAHLKWDIPMFLGIASTKDGRGPEYRSCRQPGAISLPSSKSPLSLASTQLLPFFASRHHYCYTYSFRSSDA